MGGRKGELRSEDGRDAVTHGTNVVVVEGGSARNEVRPQHRLAKAEPRQHLIKDLTQEDSSFAATKAIDHNNDPPTTNKNTTAIKQRSHGRNEETIDERARTAVD